jgi:hypothetical protein
VIFSLVIQAPEVPTPALKELARRTGASRIVGLPGGGTVKLDGTAGPINPSDAAQTPVQAKVEVRKLDLAKSGFVDPSAGIGGVADFDGTVTSDGHQAVSSGNMTADSLKLSPKGTPAKSSVKARSRSATVSSESRSRLCVPT